MLQRQMPSEPWQKAFGWCDRILYYSWLEDYKTVLIGRMEFVLQLTRRLQDCTDRSDGVCTTADEKTTRLYWSVGWSLYYSWREDYKTVLIGRMEFVLQLTRRLQDCTDRSDGVCTTADEKTTRLYWSVGWSLYYSWREDYKTVLIGRMEFVHKVQWRQ